MEYTFYQTLQMQFKQGKSVTLLTLLSENEQYPIVNKAFLCDGIWNMLVPSKTEQWDELLCLCPDTKYTPQVIKTKSGKLLVEQICAQEQLIIFGGGHVAEPLALFGHMLEFETTIVDDRSEFANYTRFPHAKNIYCMPYEDAMQYIPWGDNCYYVIVTPGHIYDQLCLEHVLRRERFAYVGMIGSRRKIGLVKELLAAQDIPETMMEQVHMPIGLDIGANTPAEIATCIAAELIQTRARTDSSFDRQGLSLLANGTPMMLATIIEKHGSAPRGIGARLMVDTNGTLYGTTGGGAAEAQVLGCVSQIMESGISHIVTFHMDNKNARDSGMICGGSATLLLEPVNKERLHL